MAKKADYSNTHKYNNRKSFDGMPVPAGKVLVPFRKDLYGLQKGDYIQDNFTTMRLGDFRYEIGFMPIHESQFASYMKDFWKEINEDVDKSREGCCIIGKNPDGTNMLCPYNRRCTGCANKNLQECYNQKRIEILPINYEYDGKTFDIEDTSYQSVENQVLDKLFPGFTEEELKINLLAHFDKKNPRYAKIIHLSLEGKSIDDICIDINLKPSRGRQEINNAHDAVCEYLRLRHHKKNRK